MTPDVLAADGASTPKDGGIHIANDALDGLCELGQKSGTALRLWTYMLANMNYGNLVQMDLLSVADALGLSPVTIQRAAKVLCDTNYIQVIKAGNTKVYCVNSRIAWLA